MWHITQPAAALVPRAVVRKQVGDPVLERYLRVLADLEHPYLGQLIANFDSLIPPGARDLKAQLALVLGGQAPLASIDAVIDWQFWDRRTYQFLNDNNKLAFNAGVKLAQEQGGLALDVVPGAMQATLDSHAAQAAARGADLVRQISSEQRAMVQAIVQQGITQQVGVPAMARQLQQGIGLTRRQATSVQNFGRALEQYAAGDVSLDAVRSQYQLARGIRIPAKGLTAARINQLTAAYRERWVKHRATTIARTETMHALHAGKVAQWDAMQRQGLLPGGLVLEWIVTPDERLCQICMPAHGEQVQVGQNFSTGVPRPPAHPMCRCDVRQVRAGPGRREQAAAAQTAGSPVAAHLARVAPMRRAPGTHAIDGPEGVYAARKNIKATMEARQKTRAANGTVNRAEDMFLHDLQARQGFSELPEVVRRDAFDAMLARGELKQELFRGVEGAHFTDGYLYGEHFAGNGVFGNGTYTTTALDTAYGYSRGEDTVMRLALRADANVIELEDIRRLKGKLQEAANAGISGSGLSQDEFMEMIDVIYDWLDDEGRLATALGYDAIHVPIKAKAGALGAPGRKAEDYFVILNRGKVVAQSSLMDPQFGG